jgi:hypothetical protein
MARPTDALDDEQLLVCFLLNLLPERETERLDEATIVDDALAARLADVETDLIDAYVTGTLNPAVCARFETVYLASSGNRARVEVARRFRSAIDGASANAAPPETTVARPLLTAAATAIVTSALALLANLGPPRW